MGLYTLDNIYNAQFFVFHMSNEIFDNDLLNRSFNSNCYVFFGDSAINNKTISNLLLYYNQ